jgi:hypothetical protein
VSKNRRASHHAHLGNEVPSSLTLLLPFSFGFLGPRFLALGFIAP